MDKKILKLSKTLSLTEARYAAALGFDFIGFCFDKNDTNYISPTKAKEIMNWITGSEMVAEFRGENTVDEIENIISILGFEYIELHDKNLIETFATSDIKIITFNNHYDNAVLNINTGNNPNKPSIIELDRNVQKKEMAEIISQNLGISIIGNGDYETGFSDTNSMDLLQEILDETID